MPGDNGSFLNLTTFPFNYYGNNNFRILSAINKLPKVKIHFCTCVICFHLRVSYTVSEVHAAYIFMWLAKNKK